MASLAVCRKEEIMSVRGVKAREEAEQAIIRVLGPGKAHLNEYLAAIAFLETSYGYGWKGLGAGSNNMGAIQAGKSWKGEVFEYVDTHPNPDGTNTPYKIGFRKYPSREAGWDDLVRVVFINRDRDKLVQPAAEAGDSLAFSRALHTTGYYEGYGKTVEDRIRNHHKHVLRGLADGEPAADVPLKPGDKGEAVKEMQRLLGIVADGVYGPKTKDAVCRFQSSVGLAPDGIFGTEEWEAIRKK